MIFKLSMPPATQFGAFQLGNQPLAAYLASAANTLL